MQWEVQLTGDSTDLRMLADSFGVGDVKITLSGSEYVLRSTKFELLESAASVRQCAIELVNALSGSARLVLGARKAIGLGVVYRVRADGKRDINVQIGQAITFERALPLTVVHGTQIHRPADPILKWFPLVTEDLVIAKALRLRNADDLDWCDLYRLAELMLSNDDPPLHELGCVSRKEFERFKHTACSVAAAGDKARHGLEKRDPPPNPLSLTQARELTDRIMHAWLEWKASHCDSGSETRQLLPT